MVKGVKLSDDEFIKYKRALDLSGEPALIGLSGPNESLEVLMQLRETHGMRDIRGVRVTDEGILYYVN